MHDPRIGRFFAVDPLAADSPHNSPYAFSENRVIDGVELEGLEYYPVNAYNPMYTIQAKFADVIGAGIKGIDDAIGATSKLGMETYASIKTMFESGPTTTTVSRKTSTSTTVSLGDYFSRHGTSGVSRKTSTKSSIQVETTGKIGVVPTYVSTEVDENGDVEVGGGIGTSNVKAGGYVKEDEVGLKGNMNISIPLSGGEGDGVKTEVEYGVDVSLFFDFSDKD